MKHIIIALVILLALAGTANAHVPQTLNHQGYLTDAGGDPVDDTVSITFSIYDVDTAGTALWSQTQTVTVTVGVYSVVLGGGAVPQPLSLPFDTQYWLGIQVGSDAEMTPRTKLTSVPYASNADHAGHAVTASQVLCNKYEFVGFSTATSNGAGGILNFNQMCQADFSNSRMCDTKEIIKTVNIPSVTGQAWVNPTNLRREGTGVAHDDISGIYGSQLNCGGAWRNVAYAGMIVESQGGFYTESCLTALPIACCAPVP